MGLKEFFNFYNVLRTDVGLKFKYPMEVENKPIKQNKIIILDSNDSVVFEINGTKDAMLFYEILSTVWFDKSGVVYKNRDNYDSFILSVDGRFTTGYNYLSVDFTPLHENSLVNLTRNFDDLFIMFRYKTNTLRIEYPISKISFSDLSTCWVFVSNIKGQINCSVGISYLELKNMFLDWQIIYICYLLQYSAKTWCKEILKERNKEKLG